MLTPGQNTITAVATDLAENTSQDTITITYTPDQSPYITGITPPVGTQLEINDAINIQITAQDPEGDDLEYQFKIDGEIKQGWSAQNTYTWQTTSEDLGTHTVTCEVRDDYCGFTTQNVSYEVVLELTPPSTPVVTDDGEYTTNNTQLHASWISEDSQTGIAEYRYSIGTAGGTTDIVNWTTAGTNIEITRTGLNLIQGQEYFFNVKAVNGSGMISDIGYSDGIMINHSVPVILTTTPAEDSFYSGDLAVLSITANDADGDPLEYRFSINDNVVQTWSNNSSYNWYPQDTDKGECAIKYEVRDGYNGEASTEKDAYIFYAPIAPPEH